MKDAEAIIGIIEQHALEGRARVGARHYERAGKPYRPSTGSEGAAFEDSWCCHCIRDAAFQDDPDHADGCPILADTFAFDIDDPQYPKEWVHDRNGRPCCTAFTTDPAKPLRCDKTLDLFSNGQSQTKT